MSDSENSSSKIIIGVAVFVIIVIFVYVIFSPTIIDSNIIIDNVLPTTGFIKDFTTVTYLGNFNNFTFNNLSSNNDNNLWEFINVTSNTNNFYIRAKIPSNNGLYLSYDGTKLFLSSDNSTDNSKWLINFNFKMTYDSNVNTNQYSISSLVNGKFMSHDLTSDNLIVSSTLQYFNIESGIFTGIDGITDGVLYTINFFQTNDTPLILSVAEPQAGTKSLTVFTNGFNFNQIGEFSFITIPEAGYYQILLNVANVSYQFVCKYTVDSVNNVTYNPIAIPYPNEFEADSPNSLVYWDVYFNKDFIKLEPRMADITDSLQYVLGLDSKGFLEVKNIINFDKDTDFAILSLK